MDVPGSSSDIATSQEPVLSDDDSCHRSSCGQWAIAQMNLPVLVLA
ncbi:MAG: hypothetical protein IGR93_15750 [Hydrococcus sp. C42_A2020_068]|nr:hypothetical protein [Hydrococcus sp. C42_A2020_068]